VYDGWNLLVEADPSNVTQRKYMWGLDLSGSEQGAGGVGGLIAIQDMAGGTGVHFAAYDGNGNIAALVKASDGTVSATYEYGPFGEVIRSSGTMAKTNSVRFSTKYQDDETDLLYYGFRYYSPSTGRWLSRDPIQEEGGLNLYNFAANRPPTSVDTLGLIVGTITPNVSEKLTEKGAAGWSVRINWRPPDDWPIKCPPCEKAVWVQNYGYQMNRFAPEMTIVQYPTKDWDETNFKGNATPWVNGQLLRGQKYDVSEMWDDPGLYGWRRRFVRTMRFTAESCVKCIKGRDNGKFYGCIYWGYVYERDNNPSVTGGVYDTTDSPQWTVTGKITPL